MPEHESGEQQESKPERLSGPIGKVGFAAVAWLALLGLAAAIVGGHDAVAGTEINVRLVGSLLLAAGLVLLAGAAGVVRRTPVGLSLAMIAALLGVAVGIMTFLTQAVNDEPDGRLVAWAAIIVASGLAAVYVRAVTPPGERAKGIWNRLPILKSAVSIGVLFSIVQFWYSLIYLPTTAPPSLTLVTKLDKVIARGNHHVIKGSVSIENTSDTRVQVLASSLDVTGRRFKPPRGSFATELSDADLSPNGMADRHIDEKSSTLVSYGRLVDEGTFFEAEETITVPILTWVPKGRYEALRLAAGVTVGRGKTLGIEGEVSTPCASQDGVVYRTRVPEAGWMRRLTRGSRYLRVRYSGNPGIEPPVVRFAPGQEPDPPREPRKLQSRLPDLPEPNSLYSVRPGLQAPPIAVGEPPGDINRPASPPCDKKWDPPECVALDTPGCASPSDPLESFNRRLIRFYGVADTSSAAVMSLP